MDLRKYIATYDDGHDYGSFEYFSHYRNNSKANLNDCKLKAQKLYGYKRASRIKIVHTEKVI